MPRPESALYMVALAALGVACRNAPGPALGKTSEVECRSGDCTDAGGLQISDGATPGSAEAGCTIHRQPPHDGQGTCEDLSRLTLSHPKLTRSDESTLRVRAGETVTLQVSLGEISGYDFNWSPGVVFETESPGVSFGTDPFATFASAIFACRSIVLAVPVTFGDDVESVINVMARVAMLGENCPEAHGLTLRFEIVRASDAGP